jgi:hypothetical protein
MKLGASIVLVLALLVASSLAASALPASHAAPAPAALQLATPAAPAACAAGTLAFLPAPIASDVTIPCGACSSTFCQNHVVGQFCGPTTVGRCVQGPSCTSGGVTCLCQ